MEQSLIIEGCVARCPSCGHIVEKYKEGNYNSFCKKCGQDFLITEEQVDRIRSDKVDKVKDNDGNKVEKKQSLSSEYSILEFYKGLAFLLMFVATGYFIYSLVQFIDAPDAVQKMLENAMLTSTVTYVVTMFSLFCLTKIINFLFDLDKKTDK